MRLAHTILAAASLAGLTAACNGGGKELTTTDGYRYTLANHTEGARHAKAGDFLTMHATYKVDMEKSKDSVLGSSHQQGMPYTLRIDTSSARFGGQKDPFLSAHLALSEGDSALFIIPSDSLFKGAAAQQRPPFLKPGSMLKLGVRVLRIEDEKTQTARINSEVAKLASKGVYQELGRGIRIQLTQKGNGPLPVKGDTLTVHYTGYFADTLVGKKPFDSSVHPPQPGRPSQPFKLVHKAGMVIPGWDTAFAAIPEGSKARILIPAEAGYGAQGAPGAIPPNSNLIFDVELLKITKPMTRPTASIKK